LVTPVVNAEGTVLSPSLFDGPEARQFRLNNDRFLGSCESVEVYWTAKSSADPSKGEKVFGYGDKGALTAAYLGKGAAARDGGDAKVLPEEAEFKQLVGDAFEGIVARFLQNKLKVLLWYRSAREPEIIYGAQVSLSNIIAGLRPLVHPPDAVRADIDLALLNDTDSVVAGAAKSGRPFVTSEIGHVLPHWRVAVHLTSPEVLARSVRSLKLTLTLIVVVMISAIALGSFLIVADLRGQLALARQKTDFVSNVSHELKTPLTSIRMFSELLGEGKVASEAQRAEFLQIISAETARLTRLINNVLDFAGLERGEKKYRLEPCDLNAVLIETVAAYRPQLEAKGFKVQVTVPDRPTLVSADCDALAQIIVNLISNAEKYSAEGREIAVEAGQPRGGQVEVRVLDRGPGVPRGCEEKIFEQFFRAHDSLSSGIQGSGLGLTLARQLMRAHGGNVRYERREGGGSSFIITLPALEQSMT
jgi:signal transduction histidine kinase